MNIDKDIEIVRENFDFSICEKVNNICEILDKNRGIFPSEFIEDLIYIIDKLVHEQLKPTQLTACETLMERQKYEIQKAKDERYKKRIERQDKIIDLMAKEIQLSHKDIELEGWKAKYANFTIEEIIKDFKRKVKKDE